MKNLLIATLIIGLLAIFSFGQSKDEQDIMKIHLGLEKAYVAGQVAPFEAALADTYSFTGPNGKLATRADSLKEMRDEIAKPTFKNISEVSDGIKINVIGNAAYVTSGWTSVSQGLDDGSAPHTDMGRYLGVYEKQNGKWMLVSEVFTEAPHDRKKMEAEVLAASDGFDAAMRSRDKSVYERLLNKDYTYTTEDGELVTRDQDIAHFANVVITTAEASDKKVRITGNTSAVETGMYHVIGTSKGKAFDETGRYTTTWIWRDMRWQVIADHNSLVKK